MKELSQIELKGISKAYLEGEKKHQILKEINHSFDTGKFSVLLGKSGSGKSTLLNLLSGIDTPDHGDILIGNQNLTKLNEEERTIFRRQSIGIIFQFFHLIPTLTALENITLPLELLGKNDIRNKALKILEKVGMENRFNAFPDKLSGGEQQRVAIARALVHEPDLVIADEPTGNLDETTGKQVLDLLIKVTREEKKTLIMATHSLEIIPFADAVFKVEQGHIVPLENHAKN